MDSVNISPITALINLAVIGTPLVMLAWILLHKKSFATIRSWAISWFLIFVVIGTILCLYTHDMSYLVISVLFAVIGSIGVLLLPKSQPNLVKKLKLKF